MRKRSVLNIGLTLIILLLILSGCDSGNTVIEDFELVENKFIDYKFKIEEEQDSFTIVGEYDLNGDGNQDKINLKLQKNTDTNVDTYIEVNGIKEEIYMSYTLDGETRLIDLDEGDGFIEVVYFDEGPSADPTYFFYRYDGEKLYKIVDVEDGALVNGQGKIIPSNYLSNFEPIFYSAWLEIENNEFLLKERDTDEYLGKDYRLHDSTNALFVPMEEIPDDYSPSWNEDNLIDLEGIELTLIDIHFPDFDENILNFYLVELEDGERGMLYFWIGD